MADKDKKERLEIIFDHLVLPAQIHDTSPIGKDEALNRDLGQLVQKSFALLENAGQKDVWSALRDCHKATQKLANSKAEKQSLLASLSKLSNEADPSRAWIVLHVFKQNCGLIIHKRSSDIVFEVFQASPPTSVVLKATHAIAQDFPDRVVAVPHTVFDSESFRENLAAFLEQATKESFERFAARAHKAGRAIVETRDVPSPALISEMLMSFLEGLGYPVEAPRMRKKIRDEVVLETSEAPWRRSPYWLVLRVFIRRHLASLLGDGQGSSGGVDRVYYKFLIAVILAKFLTTCVGFVHPEKVITLLAKLSRRLVKLESEREASKGTLRLAYDTLFGETMNFFLQVTTDTKAKVKTAWEGYQKAITRPIPRLPRSASAADFRIRLPSSGPELERLQSQTFIPPRRDISFDIPSAIAEGTISQIRELATQYTELHDCETRLGSDHVTPEIRCEEIAQGIIDYIKRAVSLCTGDSLLMSQCLLRLFEQWVVMDKAALEAYPGLAEHHPVFIPCTLDVLCLQTRHEMLRLMQVQNYLLDRISRCQQSSGTNIFSDPESLYSLPLRFVRSSNGAFRMTALGNSIDAASHKSRLSTERRLDQLMEQYRELTADISTTICTCTYLLDGTKDVRGCTRCFKWRSRNRLHIVVHEDFLPNGRTREGQRAAILFELQLPEFLKMYREATWELIILGTDLSSFQAESEENKPFETLEDIEQLEPWVPTRSANGSIILASRTKSLMHTHYRSKQMPTDINAVILPFAPQFSFYDRKNKIWTSQLESRTLNFEHLLGSWIPHPQLIADPYTQKDRLLREKVYPPSSYEIAASEADCPPDLSVQEFSAFQRAISARGRRWMVLLVELGATNVNFSSETTMKLFNHLAIQAGPCFGSDGVLREAHVVFNDSYFCEQLHEQLRIRLEAISMSWREAHYMSTMIRLSLRFLHICPQVLKWMPKELLEKARKITSAWIVRLRKDVRSAEDSDTAQKAALHAFYASLLCRQICLGFMRVDVASQTSVDRENMTCYLRASIAMQEHLIVDIQKITPQQRLLLGQDLYDSYRLRAVIQNSLSEIGMSCLQEIIDETWSSGGQPRTYSAWTFLPGQDGFWIAARASSYLAINRPQVVHYHLLQGHLLVDGKPLGRLPLSMRENKVIKELFGQRYLLTRPSSLSGMEYQLVSDLNYHTVHFGLKGKQVTIKAVHRGQVLEYVNPDIFRPSDLPSPLIDDCVHWLNAKAGELEMRRKTQPWTQKRSNWILYIRTREVKRNTQKPGGGSRLIDPQSTVGQQVAGILQGFEDVDKLVMFAPGNGVVNVEMKRLELSFHVNKHKLLQSNQLRCEIDPNQDIGTFHGLQSGIVLRNILNFGQRSIMIPLGGIVYTRRGMHTAVHITNNGEYSRFSVDSVLGKLDCPPEPVLLYMKAHLHAVTSFVLPDKLTGRTGVEEAMCCLGSAISQPWRELPGRAQNILMNLKASLVPAREFYPPDREVCQKVEWDPNLTMTIQHEAIGCMAENLLLQSRTLARFQPNRDHLSEESAEQSSTLDHLLLRGLIRRHLYERPSEFVDELIPIDALKPMYFDPKTISSGTSKESNRVYSIIRGLHPDGIDTHSTYHLEPMRSLLDAKPSVGGFTDGFRMINIPELLDIDLVHFWGALVQTCRHGSPTEEYHISFMLGILAFGRKLDDRMIRWLATIATSQQLRAITPPSIQVAFIDYEGSGAGVPSQQTLGTLILRHHPQNLQAPRRGGRNGPRGGDFVNMNEIEATRLASRVLTWWSTAPNLEEEAFRSTVKLDDFKHLNISGIWKSLGPELHRVARNVELHNYLSSLTKVALHQGATRRRAGATVWALTNSPGGLSTVPLGCGISNTSEFFRLPILGDFSRKGHTGVIMTRVVPEDDSARKTPSPGINSDEQTNHKELISASGELSILNGIIQGFVESSDTTRQQYGNDLQQSLLALAKNDKIVSSLTTQMNDVSEGKIVREIEETQRALYKQASDIEDSLRAGETAYPWLRVGCLWPCISPIALLQLLRRDHATTLGPKMKDALVSYGLLLTRLQRLLRLQDAKFWQQNQRFDDEYANEGHTNWDPADYPEWLLLEIDNDILIRRSQVAVAHAIISPPSGNNSVLQMNMGQGKTSCIMPMAIAALADKNRLCRIIVPRALLPQTAQVIQSRLGRLIGRVAKHVPFSRRTSTAKGILKSYREIHENALAKGGVIISLPEHQLSFKLSGLQRLSDNQLNVAETMMDIQKWLDESSRDILDESDFILSPKTQLIYPSGPQTTVDGHPRRWISVEEILSLVENHVPYLQSEFPDGIHVVRRHRGYPILHFLHTEVEDALNTLLIDDICNGRLSTVQLKASEPAETVHEDLRDVLAPTDDPSSSTWQKASQHLADEVFGYKNLLLLRGLISHRILLLCLKKRFFVQYGIGPSRALAVPFEAKGIPSQTAEYGHPDTAIVLTCLAFYQTGLSRTQIEQSLKHIVKLADPGVGFETWIQGCDTLPTALRHWTLINTDDIDQITQLWEHLRLDRNVINQYMNTFIFPAHAKQFGLKLQASGWDIPLFVKEKITKPKSDSLLVAQKSLTTGFSGTNDNKHMLPDTIRQDDLPSLLKTNAQVLKYLVEPRNRKCLLATDIEGHQLSEIGLLKLLHSNKIRVLIDSGAYILEMENEAVAIEWLEIDHAAQGVVYFGKQNQIMVRARFLKNPMPLLASPFANNLDECVVYIDEAHTRGTDLKLPLDSKGAVTLGLNQTKDHTVQGAMRLRQLGSTQTVTFVAPPEVYRSIVGLESRENTADVINSIDVVRWLLEQSCKANDQMMSLHLAQGHDFCRRTDALWKCTKALTDRVDRVRLLRTIRQEEDQTLEQLYGPKMITTDNGSKTIKTKSSQLQSIISRIEEKGAALSKKAATVHSSTFQEVEQEREVEFEVEQVREKQKPGKLQAFSFPGLNQQLVQFVKNGDLPDSGVIVQAFAYLGNTEVGKQYELKESSSKLFVSKQFTKTIVSNGSDKKKGIIRPVEWILWYPHKQIALIIIPEEAELLLPMLRAQENPVVWLLTYSAPLTRSMCQFSRLDYFTIPSPPGRGFKIPQWVVLEVGIVAGRLYFGWGEYKPLLAWLGMAKEEGSISQCGLSSTEARKFLLDWLTFCHQTQNVLHTPMGFVCQGCDLRQDHPFFIGSYSNEPELTGVQADHTAPPSRMRTNKGGDGAYDSESEDDGEWMLENGQGSDDSSSDEEDSEMEDAQSGEDTGDAMSTDDSF